MTAVERRATIAGIGTGWLEAGDTGGRGAIVLLHDGGYGSDAQTCWGPLLGPLAEDGWHVLAPDLVGHGATDKVIRFDVDPVTQRLQHVAAWTEHIGVREPVVVGNSFGGALALQAGIRRLPDPSAVVSICGTGGVDMVDAEFAAVQDMAPDEAGLQDLVARMVPDPAAASMGRRLALLEAPGHWEALTAGRLRRPGSAGRPAGWVDQYVAALATISVPVLLIAGSEDPMLASGWADRLAARLPDASTVVVQRAKHQPQLSHPGAVLTAIRSFLADR